MAGLLKRRGMDVLDFEVLDVGSGIALDMDRDCVKLSNREVRVKDISWIESGLVNEVSDTLDACEIEHHCDSKDTLKICDDKQDFPKSFSLSPKPLSFDSSLSVSSVSCCQLNCPGSLQGKSKEKTETGSCFVNVGLEEEIE